MPAPLGEIIYSAFVPMLRMYLIIGTGFALTRAGYLGVTTARAFSDTVMMLFMPCLVFDKIINYISIDDIKTIGVICFSAFILYSINACVATAIVLLTPIPKTAKDRWVGGALLAGIMQNVSDLPISYIQAVTIFSAAEQNKGTAYVIIWLAMYVMVQFNCGLFKLVDWDFKYAENSDKDKDKDNNDSESSDANSELKLKLNTLAPHLTHASESPIGGEDDEGSIDSDGDDGDNDEGSIDSDNDSNSATPTPASPAHRRKLSNLNPVPLNLVSSRLSKKLTNASLASHASHLAISRIPSARPPLPLDTDDVLSLNQELVREYSNVQPFNKKMSHTMKIVTETNLNSNDVAQSGDSQKFIKSHHLQFLVFFLQNFKKPNSIALILGLTFSLIPWTKALFVSNGPKHLPNAPNQQPPLNFITLYAEYLGYPCVPIGLLIIGSVLARLEVSQVPKGFWKSACCHTIFRLGILPIIGMAIITQFKKIGWLTDKMAIFVCAMEFCLPSATVQIYLTAAAMKPGMKTCTPMNCMGMYLILQYSVLVIAMPITVCYCIKNVMDM